MICSRVQHLRLQATICLMSTQSARSLLDSETAVIYHHLTAKLPYLAKGVRPADLLAAVSFLCTRVQNPDLDNWKKLGCCLTYLRNTIDLKYTLAADGSWILQWWVDASFGVHPDMKSHTGATMSGYGSWLCVLNVLQAETKHTKFYQSRIGWCEQCYVDDPLDSFVSSRAGLHGYQQYIISR